MEGKNWKEIPTHATRDDEYKEVAWSFANPEAKCKPVFINRGKVTGAFVKFELHYCGICHSDVTLGRNEMGGSIYPIVPGHELAGVVTEVGPDVTKVKVGDKVGVGCISDACLQCGTCKCGQENYCEMGGSTHTYCSMKNNYGDKSHFVGNPETPNYGGYSGSSVIHEHFIIKFPDSIDFSKAAPILCAGITMFDPLVHWKAWDAYKQGKKMNIGIIGVGGLGTMGIKLANAMGHNVTAISTSPNKKEIALQKGAHNFIISKDEESMKSGANSIDLILNTISAQHEVMHYLPLLKTNGVIVELGLNPTPHSLVQLPLMFTRKSIAGSLIGGIKNTELLFEFCAEKQIYPDVKLVTASEIDQCWETLQNISKDGVRYVIDVKKSLEDKSFLPQE